MSPFKPRILKSLFSSIVSVLIVSFLGSSIAPFMPPAHAESPLVLPQPGVMIDSTAALKPTLIKGIQIFPDQPLKFDLIIDPADSKLREEALKTESSKLIKYFLASLTVPEDDH